MISQGSLYRGDQYKSDLEAFVALKKKYEVVPREERDNFCWVESAKVGYVGRIRNTAIGTLLVDISNGRELDESVRAYERIVAPANYQRPKTIATKKMIQAAEARVIELGLKESQTESFIKIRTKDTTELELKFNIVKHIIDVKLQEQEERIVAAEKKAKRQKILDLMAKKQDAELESKSYEELAKELEALS